MRPATDFKDVHSLFDGCEPKDAEAFEHFCMEPIRRERWLVPGRDF
ncbi:hypothetical protein JCM16307_16030 [Thermococcus prieurii]